MVPARARKGQATVEMALLLPLFLLLVLGIIEFGRAWNVKHVVTDATREAARHAVVQDPMIDQDSVRGVVAAAMARAGIPWDAVTLTFDEVPTPTGHWRETGAMQTVSLDVQYKFGFFGPIFKAASGSDAISIHGRVTMRNE